MINLPIIHEKYNFFSCSSSLCLPFRLAFNLNYPSLYSSNNYICTSCYGTSPSMELNAFWQPHFIFSSGNSCDSIQSLHQH